MTTRKRKNSQRATILGVLTTILMQITVIDYSQFDFNNATDLVKFMLTLIPAVGGSISSFVEKGELFKNSSWLATVLGLLTSTCTAWVAVDWTVFDFHDKNNWVKLFVLALPALSGFVSKVNGNTTIE